MLPPFPEPPEPPDPRLPNEFKISENPPPPPPPLLPPNPPLPPPNPEPPRLPNELRISVSPPPNEFEKKKTLRRRFVKFRLLLFDLNRGSRFPGAYYKSIETVPRELKNALQKKCTFFPSQN